MEPKLLHSPVAQLTVYCFGGLRSVFPSRLFPSVFLLKVVDGGGRTTGW